MRAWIFSVDASIGIVADDRPALERLLRCFARRWSLERLTKTDDGERPIYGFDTPRPAETWRQTLTPWSCSNGWRGSFRCHDGICIAALLTRRIRGAPHPSLRAQVAARAGQAIAAPVVPATP